MAKDYPADDPNFDPDDIRYSCYRYITTETANSMGPAWIDPVREKSYRQMYCSIIT